MKSWNDEAIVLGEWSEIDVKDVMTWTVNGKVIHFSKGMDTLYVGYMLAHLRHGYGMEIPLKNREYRKESFSSNWIKGKRVEGNEEFELELKTSSMNYLNALLLKVITKWSLNKEEESLK